MSTCGCGRFAVVSIVVSRINDGCVLDVTDLCDVCARDRGVNGAEPPLNLVGHVGRPEEKR